MTEEEVISGSGQLCASRSYEVPQDAPLRINLARHPKIKVLLKDLPSGRIAWKVLRLDGDGSREAVYQRGTSNFETALEEIEGVFLELEDRIEAASDDGWETASPQDR